MGLEVKSMRKVRGGAYTERSRIHLQLRMHILRELCRANERRLSKLRR